MTRQPRKRKASRRETTLGSVRKGPNSPAIAAKSNSNPRVERHDKAKQILPSETSFFSSQPFKWLVLLGLSILPFLPSLYGQIIWDDEIIASSQATNGLKGLRNIWSPFAENGREFHYWPITYTSFWIEDQLWGLMTPLAHHSVNILLHAINGLLAWRLLIALGVPGAFLAAALFAVHPVHTESVAWISGRKDLLAAFFYMLSAWVWFGHQSGDASRVKFGRLVLALLLYLAAMLSKTTAVTLPVALFFVLWWKHGRITKKDLSSLAPFFVLGLGWAAIETMLAAPTTYLIDIGLDPSDRIVLMAKALGLYATLAVLPVDLALLYPKWTVDGASAAQWIPVLALLAIVSALWVLRYRIGRGWLAAVAIYWVTLLPVLGIIDFGYLPYTFVADRFQYIALLVPAALLAAVASHVLVRWPTIPRAAGYALAAIITSIFGFQSWNQSA